MEPDDIAGEVPKMIRASVARGYVHAMDSREAAWESEAREFLDHVAIVLEEFSVVAGVGEVAFRAGIVVEPPERGRVDGEVDGAIGERRHDLAAVAEVEGVFIGHSLI